jgi:hypothetical protein
MKKCLVVTVLALLVFAANAWADEPNQPKAPREPAKHKITIAGTVSVTKDKDGSITGVKFTTIRNIGYNITLDAKGKELAEKLAGKSAVVTGVPETKDQVKWLTVEKFASIANPPGPKSPKELGKK